MRLEPFAISLAAAAAVAAGLRIPPHGFGAYRKIHGVTETQPLPAGLPAPVDRFYRLIYGDRIPVVTSAVVTGRATIAPFGVDLQARFRFIHVAGRHYRHYIEATFFGWPVLRVNERYVDGVGVGELPFGIVARGPQQDQAANIGLWAESMWFPSLYVTDDRVAWHSVDANTAILAVPFDDAQEQFVVRFDPASGLPTMMETMRYKGPDATGKTLWINEALEWGMVGDVYALRVASAMWLDDGKPWATFTVDDLSLNVRVDDYVRQRGL